MGLKHPTSCLTKKLFVGQNFDEVLKKTFARRCYQWPIAFSLSFEAMSLDDCEAARQAMLPTKMKFLFGIGINF